jgi:seryl-tRNA synthetase
MREVDQARLLRDEASRLRQQLKEMSERLRTVDAEIAALQQRLPNTRPIPSPRDAQES